MTFRYLCTFLAGTAALCTVAAKPEAPDPGAILKNLYKLHDAQKGPFFERKNRVLLEKYFTKELATLLLKDAAAADGEVGAYDFDPLYASQDPQVKNFKIGPAHQAGVPGREGNSVREAPVLVAVTFKDNGEVRELRFEFEHQPDKTWRISEIHYPDGISLLQLLRKAYPG